MKMVAGSRVMWAVAFIIVNGRGRSRAISISKIKKITAKRKNRSENGVRAE